MVVCKADKEEIDRRKCVYVRERERERMRERRERISHGGNLEDVFIFPVRQVGKWTWKYAY
jgi:hypothetical protein